MKTWTQWRYYIHNPLNKVSIIINYSNLESFLQNINLIAKN